MGVPPYPGVGKAVKVRGWGGLLQPFQFEENINSPFWKKYLHTMMLKLTEHVGITIFLLYKQKPGEILIFRTFIAKLWIFWIFAYFSLKIAIFRSGIFLWRHNYVTPWPIVLTLVCMDRGGPYTYLLIPKSI